MYIQKILQPQEKMPIIVCDEIPLDLPLDATITLQRNLSKTVHNVGNQAGKFIPELPRWAIKKYGKSGQTILDPFVGSGTTLVEANLLGFNGLGIDNNPIALLISKVKTTPLSAIKLKEYTTKLFCFAKESIFIPKFKALDFWFDKPVIDALSRIKSNIDVIDEEDYRNFFLVCFSLTVQKTSNCAGGQILTAKRKEYNAKHFQEKDVIESFKQQVEEYSKLILEYSRLVPRNAYSNLVGNDARDLSKIPDFDLIVTSPPYINAIDYVWANKLRLHWLGFVDDATRLDLSRKEIGTEYIPKIETKKEPTIGLLDLDEKLDEIYRGKKYTATIGQNKLRAHCVKKYFKDMWTHFKEASNKLETNAYYVIVCGDNTICKVYLPTTDYLSEIASISGLEEKFRFKLLLKNRFLNIPRQSNWAGNIKYDNLLVFQKT